MEEKKLLHTSFGPKTKLNILLASIKTKNGRYKRYLASPLRYAGGKSWAVGYVLERFPKNINRLVSPFFGGGSIEIACAKVGIEVLGFDIFNILVDYWQVQIESPKELYLELSKLKPDKETYAFVKKRLKDHWEGREKLDKLTLAAYYYFNHNLSYGPGFLGWLSSVYAKERVYRRMLQKVKNFKVNNLWVECASFEEVLPEYKKEFLYLDPPYYIGEDSDVFIGLYPMRNFPIHHKGFKHELLRDLLYNHEGGFILSYNDCPTIRDWYRDFGIVELPVKYTMGQGETRIGKNRKNNGRDHTKPSRELLIIKGAH